MFAADHCADDPNFSSTLQAHMNNKDAAMKVKISDKTNVITSSEGASEDEIFYTESTISNANEASEGDSNNNDEDNVEVNQVSEDVGSATQVTRSGRVATQPKRFMKTAILGLLSLQIGKSITSKLNSAHSTSILKSSLDHDNVVNKLPDQTNYYFHPLTCVDS